MNMKHNVGDKVRIKSLDWYKNAPKDEYGDILISEKPQMWFTFQREEYCGKEATIISITADSFYYKINVDNGKFLWVDEMFEDEAVHLELDTVPCLNPCTDIPPIPNEMITNRQNQPFSCPICYGRGIFPNGFYSSLTVSAMSSGGLRGTIYQTTRSLRAGQDA